jgi:multicomponent Na+:H+ antiporter subunit E
MKKFDAFLGTLVLPIIWMALTGQFTLANFVTGFIISFVCLWLITSPTELPFAKMLARLLRFVGFLFFFLWEVLVANLRVAWEVITPRHHMQPAIVAIPLTAKSDLEITILANVITLTPGTLSLDVSPDRKMLYVHTMYVSDVDAFRRDIKERFERRVIEVFG